MKTKEEKIENKTHEIETKILEKSGEEHANQLRLGGG